MIFMLFLMAVTNAYSIGYSPWTGMTGEKTVAINPYIGVSVNTDTNDPGNLGFLENTQLSFDNFIVNWGLSDSWDILTLFAGKLEESWIMGRYSIVDDYLIVGLRVGYGNTAVEFHSLTYELGNVFNIEVNTSFQYTYLSGGESVNELAYSAFVVPSLTFGFFSIYLEINPFIVDIINYDSANFSLDLVPGIHFALPDGSEVSIGLLGLTLNNDNQFSISEEAFREVNGIGIWYWKAFDIGG